MNLLLISAFCSFVLVSGAPKSRNKNNAPQTVYDQKQTGDYNIQLHLKDFQIIALLGDDSLGGLGDYDYNYDYSDFTVKPPNATQKPTTTTPQASSSTTTTTEKFSTTSNKQDEVQFQSTTTTPNPPEKIASEKLKSTQTPNSPDKIKVQILEGPHSPDNISIVPNDDLGLSNEASALGEILYYRRCASGYARDKKGRCRRVRKPGSAQMPFDISRLASNLAARFRQENLSDSSASSSSESLASDSAEDEQPEEETA